MSQVFVSYVREDAEKVNSIVNYLKEENIDCWLDVDSLKAGEQWEQVVSQKIRSCTALLLIISINLFKAKESYIWKELEYVDERLFLKNDRTDWFIPVIVDNTPPPEVLLGKRSKKRISEFQSIEINRRRPAAISQLVKRLQALDQGPHRDFVTLTVVAQNIDKSVDIKLTVDGIATGDYITRNGVSKYLTRPGKRVISGEGERLEDAGEWSATYSLTFNAIVFEANAGEIVTLNIRKSNRSGFLYLNKEQGVDYIIEIISQ
jgi:hypothetical protein